MNPYSPESLAAKWSLARRVHPDNHAPNCNYKATGGCLLCNCAVISGWEEWAKETISNDDEPRRN